MRTHTTLLRLACVSAEIRTHTNLPKRLSRAGGASRRLNLANHYRQTWEMQAEEEAEEAAEAETLGEGDGEGTAAAKAKKRGSGMMPVRDVPWTAPNRPWTLTMAELAAIIDHYEVRARVWAKK